MLSTVRRLARSGFPGSRLPVGKRTVVAILVLAVVGPLILLLATRWGIGISPDSVSYISAARNLLEGRGLITFTGDPLIHHPPGFPIALAMIGLLGVDPLAGAGWLNCLTFGLNVLLVGFLLARLGPRLPWLPVLGSLLVMSSHAMLSIHSMAWTEPLFLFSGFLGLAFLAEYLGRGKTSLLIAAAGAIAFATMLRYAGLALLATGLAALLLFDTRRVREKAIGSSIFLLVASAPMALWSLRNMLVFDSPVNRELAVHLFGIEQLGAMIETFRDWLLPDSWLIRESIREPVSTAFLAIYLIAISVLVSFWIQRARRRAAAESGDGSAVPGRRLEAVITLFSLVYISFLVVSFSFFDAYIKMNHRILSPLFIAGVILGSGALESTAAWAERAPGRRSAIFGIVQLGLLGLVGLHLMDTVHWTRQRYLEGVGGFATRAWHESELLRQIDRLPAATPIVTNGADAIYLFTGRHAQSLPHHTHVSSMKENEQFLRAMDKLQIRIDTEGAMVAYFNALNWRWYMPKKRQLRDLLTLEPFLKTSDGILYRGSTASARDVAEGDRSVE